MPIIVAGPNNAVDGSGVCWVLHDNDQLTIYCVVVQDAHHGSS